MSSNKEDSTGSPPFIIVADEYGYFTNNILESAYALAASTRDSHLQNIDISIIDNRSKILDLLKTQHLVSIEKLSPIFKHDREIAILSVKNMGSNIKFLDKRFQEDREILSYALHSDPFYLEQLGKDIKKDKQLVMIALSQNGYVFRYIDDSLKNDVEVILCAVSNKGLVLSDLDKTHTKNKKIVMAAILSCADSIQYMDPSLNDDEQIISTAIRSQYGGKFIKYASERLKSCRTMAMLAINNNGLSLRFLSEELRNDKEVALAAIKNNHKSYKNIGHHLKTEIGKHDPVEYLEKAIMNDKLEHILQAKEQTKEKSFHLRNKI